MNLRGTGRAVVVLGLLGLGGCIEVDAPPYDPYWPPADAGPAPDSGVTTVVRSSRGVRPIATRGGGLLLTGDQRFAYAVDPERDLVSVVAVGGGALSLVGDVELPVGSDPGSLVEDGRGQVHVVLRGTGLVARLDGLEIVSRREVCAAPRGIAWRASDDMLLVACADGFLAQLPAAGGPATLLPLEDDLRDVVVAGDLVLVSRYLSAEVLAVDARGEVVARWSPETVVRVDALAGMPVDGRVIPEIRMVPRVALRMIPAPGGAWLLHQRERVDPIPVSSMDPAEPSAGAYGSGADRDATFGCAPSMIEAAVTFVGATAASGTIRSSLPVPVALATDLSLGENGVVVVGREAPSACFNNVVQVTDPLSPAQPLAAFSEASSVALGRDGQVFVLALSPTRLTQFDAFGRSIEVVLARSVEDVGSAIFHQVTPSGLACASCHPEGGDDGHVWTFAGGMGVRTQSVRGGILDSAPFHWAGDMVDFDALMAEGFVRRMSGTPPTREELSALASFVDGLPAPLPPHVADDSVERGRRLFESSEVGCAFCHFGSEYTAHESLDVGTGRPFQPAVLLGAAYRAPYMHDGCAPTLRDVIAGDPACSGGASHVRTAGLSPEEIDDLIAYVRTR